MNIQITFDSKESDSDRVHAQAVRLCYALKDKKFDIEVAGLVHLFLKACGITQRELDIIYHKEEKNSESEDTYLPGMASWAK